MKLTIQEAQEMMKENNGSLDLEGCTGITELPERLTVGGWLNLRDTGITELPEGLTVGEDIYLLGADIVDPVYNRLENGDYVEGKYLYADGILTHIKRKKQVEGYTLYIGKIPHQHVVSDGELYAHCKTLREGIADIAFKRAKERGAEQYRDITLDSVLTAEKMIEMYRVITGACRQGTERFVKSLGELRETYTVREAVELTKGQYGAERFAAFFGVSEG